MASMATEISVLNAEEFEQLIFDKDIRIAKALVNTILDNLKKSKKTLPCVVCSSSTRTSYL